jgi:hypothetical protein
MNIKELLKKFISFYTEPYSAIELKKEETPNNYIPDSNQEKKKKHKEEKQTIYSSFVDYYKKKTRKILLQVIVVTVILFIGTNLLLTSKIPILTQPWFWIFSGIIMAFTFIKPGLYYILERKREIVDGFFIFMDDYIGQAQDVSFKAFVDELLISPELLKRYPKIFVDEFLIPLGNRMKIEHSTTALKRLLELPRNQYFELVKFREFIINTLDSNDSSLREALKSAISIASEGKRRYAQKMQSGTFISYLAIGMMIGFPTVFIGIFMSSMGSGSQTSLQGLTAAQMMPTPLDFTLWFGSTVIASTVLILISYYYSEKEGESITKSYYTLILLYVVVIIIYSMLALI